MPPNLVDELACLLTGAHRHDVTQLLPLATGDLQLLGVRRTPSRVGWRGLIEGIVARLVHEL